jgi:hypothetical protein
MLHWYNIVSIRVRKVNAVSGTGKRPKNLTISMNREDNDDLDFLIDYFQKQSIATVTKSDLVKFLIKQCKYNIDQGRKPKISEIMEMD